MSCTRRLMKRLSGWTTSASARFCTRLAKAVSISASVLAVKNSICGPMAVAAGDEVAERIDRRQAVPRGERDYRSTVRRGEKIRQHEQRAIGCARKLLDH